MPGSAWERMSSQRNFFDPSKLTGVRLVGQRCLFQAVGMTKKPRIGHDGTSGEEMANDKIGQPQEDDQGQVGGPQVPLLGRGDEKETQNWACRD